MLDLWDKLWLWLLSDNASRATVILVFITGLYAILTWRMARAVAHQTEATARSAKAAERSVRLQENTQRQWLNLENWEVFRINPADPLEIQVEIVNPTSLPLTLHITIVAVDGKGIEGSTPITLLTPSNPFIHSFGICLNSSQEALYSRNALSFNVECSICFADSHGIHWRQDFGRMLGCGHNMKPIVTDTKNALEESGVPGNRGSREVQLP
jgi:hypothetical protein